MTRTYAPLILLLFLSLITGACSSSKKSVSNKGAVPSATGATNDVETYFSKIVDECTPWQQLKVPFNVSISQPTQISASGQATMVRGEYINLSVRILGMEVAALYLTNDSVLVIDRWNKRYISENLRRFLKGFPADISNLQDMLTGRPFVLGQEKITARSLKDFSVEQNGTIWGIKPTRSEAGLDYAFIFSQSQFSAIEVAAGKTEVHIAFGEPSTTQFGTFASSINISALTPSKPIDGAIQWRWSKAQFNNSFSAKHIETPKGYTRINADELLSKLKVQ